MSEPRSLRRSGPRLGSTPTGNTTHLFAADTDRPLCRSHHMPLDIASMWWSEWKHDSRDPDYCITCCRYALGLAVVALEALDEYRTARSVRFVFDNTYPPDIPEAWPRKEQDTRP